MSRFYVVNESTEDTLDSANNLPDAISAAKEAARQGRAGDLVSVLECGGQAVKQFVLLSDGMVAEQAITRCVNRSQGEPGETASNNLLPRTGHATHAESRHDAKSA